MRAARFMLARARVRLEGRGRRRWWISLFSASLCLPSHCCWRRFWYLCAMLDYRWLFNIRVRNAWRFLGRPFCGEIRQEGIGSTREREIHLIHSFNLAVNVLHPQTCIRARILLFLRAILQNILLFSVENVRYALKGSGETTPVYIGRPCGRYPVYERFRTLITKV